MNEAGFWERVPPRPSDPAECWLWEGYINPDGYGRLGQVGAHRISYELHVGPIPDGLVIDHLCRVRHCVSPDHMEPVTNRENILRGRIGEQCLRTHCPHGHEYDEANTIVQGDGKRRCRACRRAIENRRNRRKRAAA